MLADLTDAFASTLRIYLLAVGLALLALACVLLGRRVSALIHGASAIGRVIGHETRTDDDSVVHLPIVEFTDAGGRTHRFTSRAGTSTPRPAVGATLRVVYMTHDPARAYVRSFLHMWAAPAALVLLGAASLFAAWKHAP